MSDLLAPHLLAPDLLAHYESCFEALASETRLDPPWLAGLRQSAARRFADLGFPTVRLEEWRYTNPAALAKQPFDPARDTMLAAPDLAAIRAAIPDASTHVFVDGRRDDGACNPAPEGAEVFGLAELRRNDPSRLEGWLGRLSEDAKDNALAALNMALLDDGAVVVAARNRPVAAPIHVLFASTRAQAGSALSSPRLLVIAEAGSELTLWLDYAAPPPTASTAGAEVGFTNSVVEVHCAEGASVNLVIVQREAENHLHVGNTFVAQERDSRFASHTFTLSGRLVRNELNTTLAGEGADCTMNGLFLGSDAQRVDNHTLVDHAVPHCTSRELYKGVLGGKSRGVFRGRVVVRPDAQKTSAEQNNANLIVSDGAEVDTKPQLEIYADDVRCSHGSTVGQLDADAIFYLRSRGISEAAARDLLTRGFAQELVTALPSEAMREACSALLAGALERVARGGPAR